MKFDQYPEPFVTGPTVRAMFGDVSDVTLWRWCNHDGCPYHLARNGRRLYKLSEVEAWLFATGGDQDDSQFKRTGDTETGVA